MKPNLDTLKHEIEEHLVREGMAVFYGYSRLTDQPPIVYWNTDEHPDYKLFVGAAKAAGAQMIVFHHREFTPDEIDDATDRLQTCDLPRDEYHKIERRIEELRAYEGFTCAIELSFDAGHRIYVFDLRTSWYEDLTDMLDDLEILDSDVAAEDDEGPIGGFFSKN